MVSPRVLPPPRRAEQAPRSLRRGGWQSRDGSQACGGASGLWCRAGPLLRGEGWGWRAWRGGGDCPRGESGPSPGGWGSAALGGCVSPRRAIPVLPRPCRWARLCCGCSVGRKSSGSSGDVAPGAVDTADGPLRWPPAALCNAAARAGTILPEHRAVTCPLRSSNQMGFGFRGGLPQGAAGVAAVHRTRRQSRSALLVSWCLQCPCSSPCGVSCKTYAAQTELVLV